MTRAGDSVEAQRLLEEFETFARQDIESGSENYTLFLSMAASRAMRGDSDAACDWLERANATAGVALEWVMENDPLLESIRSLPRFGAIELDVSRTATSLRTAILEQER
jgi:hypothetical protein